MAAQKETESKASGGIVPLIVAIVLATAIGAGAGFGAVTMFAPSQGTVPSAGKEPKSEAEPAKPEAKEAKSGEAEKHGEGEAEGENAEEEEAVEPINVADLAFAPIPPVIVNLVEPTGTWLRMEGGITFLKSGEKKPELLAAESSQQIAQYLKTLKVTDIGGPDALQLLQDDLSRIAKTLSDGQVQKVLITGIVVE